MLYADMESPMEPWRKRESLKSGCLPGSLKEKGTSPSSPKPPSPAPPFSLRKERIRGEGVRGSYENRDLKKGAIHPSAFPSRFRSVSVRGMDAYSPESPSFRRFLCVGFHLSLL